MLKPGDKRAKLDPEAVALIRERRRKGETVRSIAKDYPVTEAQISNICREISWKQLPPSEENDGLS